MATKTVPLTAISVQTAKPTTKFGQLAYIPIANTAWMYARAALSGIPSNAVVTSATLTLTSRTDPWAGARTVKVRTATASFSTSTTWNTRPGSTTAGEVTLTKTNSTYGTKWDFDVTAMAQQWVSGALANNGFLIYQSDTVVGTFQGATAPGGQPVLSVVYSVLPVAPTGLNPASGAVSVAKPTLQFQTPSDTTSVQVQVDPAANATTPAFDSGTIATSAGLVDLSTTAYAGLADGASTKWRARVKNALGWSPWSSWVTFNRVAWKTLTITSPGSTSEDPTPVIEATYAGTITAWRVQLRNSSKTLEDSGWRAGSTVSYGTTKAGVGGSGNAVVFIRDATIRDATPGDPDYLYLSKTFSVAPSGTPSPLTDVVASQDGVKPDVVLTGTRAAGIPDYVAIYRNGELIARPSGGSVFSGTTFTYRDRTAPMNASATYKVTAIVNDAWSNSATAPALTPRCQGIWLLDGSAEVLILGDEEMDQSQPEVAIVHTPLSGPDGSPQVVRRRLARYPRQGEVAGQLIDALGVSAATSESNLRAWVEQDAGHVYRLVLGNQNDPVILGDITFEESPLNGSQVGRVLSVSANWWYQE